MAMAIALLFALIFAVMMAFTYYLTVIGYITGIFILLVPLILTILIIVLQWGVSPLIIRWIYKIRWVDPGSFDPKIGEFIRETCREKRIKEPRFGIVSDDNPNAFAFGWTRNKAHLVLTRGIVKYCDEEEQKAVVAHELGHIAHNDFVVMTVIGAIPVLFYVIARSCYYTIRYSRGGGHDRGKVAAFVGLVAAVSFLVYLLSQLVVLLVSRYREYYADDFSAGTTRKPNALSSALVKIAYGLAYEGLGEKSEKMHDKYESALMIFNSKMARALAAKSADKYGKVSKERIKRAMAWDVWNPWAAYLELQMTHPLPAKRIVALGKKAKELGQPPFVEFDLGKPESYWDDFFKDVFARGGWLFAFPVAFIVWWYLGSFLLTLGSFLLFMGVVLTLYLKFYRYPKSFPSINVSDLVQNPKASPVRGIGAKLEGKVIGRGQPGLFFSEDLKIDDGTGLLLLDYRSIFKLIDFLVGVFETEERVGKEIQVEGWYRRSVVPYLEIYCMEIQKKRIRIWRPSIEVGGAVFLTLLGFFFLLLLFLV
ncbi:MAG: M48 family metalloprotease [Thermoplasmata archaeon]